MHALLPWVGAAQEVFSGPQLATRVALSLCFKAATRLGLPAIYDVPSSWRGWYSLEIGVEITTAITLGFLVPTPRPSPPAPRTRRIEARAARRGTPPSLLGALPLAPGLCRMQRAHMARQCRSRHSNSLQRTAGPCAAGAPQVNRAWCSGARPPA